MKLWVHERGHTAPRPVDEAGFLVCFGVKYLPHLIFSRTSVEKRVRAQCASLLARKEITPEQLWLGAFYGEQLKEGSCPDLSINWIDQQIGYGLFSKTTIKSADFICEYTGLVHPKPWMTWRPKDYNFRYPTAPFYWRKFVIDSEAQGNAARFINHSSHPNLEALSAWHDGLLHIILRATEEIPPGKQLTFDYGPLFWRHRSPPANI